MLKPRQLHTATTDENVRKMDEMGKAKQRIINNRVVEELGIRHERAHKIINDTLGYRKVDLDHVATTVLLEKPTEENSTVIAANAADHVKDDVCLEHIRAEESLISIFFENVNNKFSLTWFPTLSKEEEEKYRVETVTLEAELQSVLGEIALVTCPVVNYPTHTPLKDQNADLKPNKKKPDENNVKVNDQRKTKNNDDPKVQNSTNEKNKTKRPRPEEFKTPKKFARVAKDLLPVRTCTTQNSFAALETVRNTEEASDHPLTVTPKIKPIMMRINKNYNFILQVIFRKYPNAVNKST
ncbi:hypothetical protein TNCT_610611 [Trichonephila clavata]|uniref:Uncharacterized protein n=1 Tax=Trichonephila clavata TaxID=2740835 RepID=A0A8X6JLL2_TRICU|nr:hypothetical protein TNCT_610611 [Trichonephila clavata]